MEEYKRVSYPLLSAWGLGVAPDDAELELLLAKYDGRDEWKRIGNKLKEIRP